MRNNLKLIFMEEEVLLMLVKDRSASRAWLVDGGCHSFICLKSGKVWKATEAQRISTQVWRIPCEKISIKAVSERLDEAVGVYAQNECSILAGLGKFIPLQTNHGVTGDVLIEISDKTMPGLVLPEIVKKKERLYFCRKS